MNFLITNSVPLNGGDEALLRATIESLKKRFPASAITTLCKDAAIARKHLPDLALESDLEFVTADDIDRVGKLYRDADIVLSAPGGFLHDFYSITERLQGFEAALALQKPLILLAQSIGPFWKPESLRRVPQVLNNAARICVRDSLSKKHLLDLGIHAQKIRETADMCFLWRGLAPGSFVQKTGPIRTIALGFRVWPLKDANAEREIIKKGEQLCRFLLEDADRNLVFLSTCQGVATYVDDSTVAVEIVKQLPDALQARCRVNRSHLHPQELMKAFSQCDAFIGMRLHGAILAMLAGTPAMALGYEPKTEQIFGQLGLEAFQLPSSADAGRWLRGATEFLNATVRIRTALPEILDRACERAEVNLATVDEVAGEVQRTRRDPDSPAAAGRLLETISIPGRESGLSALAALRAIQRTIPRASRFILVDDAQWAGRFPERNPIPFLEKDGQYWGPPPDDAKAISELERLRKLGAGFIVFASPSFWWLHHYKEFHSYLQQQYQHAFANDELIIFDLRSDFKETPRPQAASH